MPCSIVITPTVIKPFQATASLDRILPLQAVSSCLEVTEAGDESLPNVNYLPHKICE
jgi:hypothetical protein